MFVTSQPGRIVDSRTVSLEKGKSSEVGTEGLYSRLKGKEGVEVYCAECKSLSGGYALSDGETLDFSGKIIIKNASEASASLSLIVFDTI